VQHRGVERDLTARIDRRGNRLRRDIEAIEAAAAGRRQAGPHDRVQAAACGRGSKGWRRRDAYGGLSG